MTEPNLGLRPATPNCSRRPARRGRPCLRAHHLLRCRGVRRRPPGPARRGAAASTTTVPHPLLGRQRGRPRSDAFRRTWPALTNLSNRLGEMGRREDALAAGSKAIDIRRELAARWPDAHHHELEQSLRVAALLKHARELGLVAGLLPTQPAVPVPHRESPVASLSLIH